MKVLVAGGAGFIGSHLIDVLLAQGNEVVCIDNLSLGTEDNLAHRKGYEGFRFYRLDLCDEEKLDRVMKKEAPEYIFQLAANSDIQASASKPLIEYKNTYGSTYHLLECMRKNQVKKIFFASTSAVYGDKRDEILDESTACLQPVSYYGAAKLGCEALLSAYSFIENMSVLIFRFANVIGPRLTHGVVYDFIAKLRKDSKKLEILGDGMQTKPYIYVTDLIQAILYLSSRVQPGVSLYNIAAEGVTSVKDIADIVCEEMGLCNVVYQFTGGEAGWKGDVPRFLYSCRKVHEVGWRASMTSTEAVRMAVKYNIQR